MPEGPGPVGGTESNIGVLAKFGADGTDLGSDQSPDCPCRSDLANDSRSGFGAAPKEQGILNLQSGQLTRPYTTSKPAHIGEISVNLVATNPMLAETSAKLVECVLA